jgi:tetratricopeptide (TPR) repeat protein
MTTSTFALLDQTELFQLALRASTTGDSGGAIAYLKEAVSRVDGTAAAHYLLGAEYAQVGLFERARDEMEAALALDPALAAARLQLGMLWLGANDNARAADVLLALGDLPADHPLRLFGTGLRYMISADAEEALRYLNEGLMQNTDNPALNSDMQKIIREIEVLAAAGGLPMPVDAEGGNHIMLSAYAGNDGKRD